MIERKQLLSSWYIALQQCFAIEDWWGIGIVSAWEYAVCAVLTQGTTWKNAKRAFFSLQRLYAKQPHVLCTIPVEEIQASIRSAGFATRKAETLRLLFSFFAQHNFFLPPFIQWIR